MSKKTLEFKENAKTLPDRFYESRVEFATNVVKKRDEILESTKENLTKKREDMKNWADETSAKIG